MTTHRPWTWPALRRLVMAAICLITWAAPAVAQADEIPMWAQAQGVQVSTWNEPYFVEGGSCFGIPWAESGGMETIKFHTAKIKVLAVTFGRGLILHYGNWNFDSVSKIGLFARGSIDREATETLGMNPGSCGGKTSVTKPQFDCKPKPTRFDVNPGWLNDNTMQLVVLEDIKHPVTYNDCPVQYPEVDRPTGKELSIPYGAFTTLDVTFPKSELLDRKIGKEIVLGKANWKDWSNPGQRPWNANVYIRWTLTFTKAH